jgi:hypothetical protein
MEVTLLGDLLQKMRHLHLLVLLLRPRSLNPTAFTLPCCLCRYSLPCRNPVLAHQKYTSSCITILQQGVARSANIFLVDQAGVEPASRTPFSLLLSFRSLQQYYYLFDLKFNFLPLTLHLLNYFRWQMNIVQIS